MVLIPSAGAQTPAPAPTPIATVSPEDALDSLVAAAVLLSPTVRATDARVDAARARRGPAGARPDPMLMAGVQNVPVSDPGFADEMSMKMVGIEQTLPYPGKLPLRVSAADAELRAAQAEADAARLAVQRDLREAYYELAYLDRALANAGRSQAVVGSLIPAAEASYGAGSGAQRDVLGARTAAAQIAVEATALAEARRAALARVNAALARPSETPIDAPVIPASLARAAVPDSASRVEFVSTALAARLGDSPLPPLDSLQRLALAHNPMLRAHEARIAAQEAREALARREHRPDVGVSLQYGQRAGLPDMVTAVVSVPLPVQKGRRQDALAAEAAAEVRALHEEHAAEANRLRAEVARLVSDAERDRAQLALYARAIMPQARAATAAATAQYEAGRGEFGALLESRTALLAFETQHERLLADFAKSVAALTETVGVEVIP